MSEHYDVIVIGGGPAGYVAAIRCAQLGLSTACIDRWRDPRGRPSLGGTCLNVGCIPSKALLESSHLYELAGEHLGEHGIGCRPELDLGRMMQRKDKVVRQLTQGVAGLFKANRITWLQGQGRLEGAGEVSFRPHEGEERGLSCDHVVLAPGSVPSTLDTAPVDGERILDSSGALALDQVPGRLGVVGAGYIGLELGSVWRRLGAEVVLFEAQDSFLPSADEAIAADAYKAFTRQGLEIRLGTLVKQSEVDEAGVTLTCEGEGGETRETVDRLIVAVGRRPATEGLFSEDSGLLPEAGGFIQVDEHCRTNLPEVYAIGDAVRGPMLAHKGSEEGIMVAERIAGQASEVNYEVIPSVIYTAPEVAWAGENEQALRAQGRDYRVGTFPFAASGRAQALGDTSGQIRVLADGGSDRVLGVHALGPQASELIAEAVIAMEMGASAEDLARSIYAHPTLSESLHEAALDVAGRPIHVARRRR